MVNMNFSQQFCRSSNTDSASHITLKMRVVENIIQYIYYAFSRTLTKIVGDVGAVSRYSALEMLLTQTSKIIKPSRKFYRIKSIVGVSVNINKSLYKLRGYRN